MAIQENWITVFSAHAEVVPVPSDISRVKLRILRARGGSSSCYLFHIRAGRYSPRTRR